MQAASARTHQGIYLPLQEGQALLLSTLHGFHSESYSVWHERSRTPPRRSWTRCCCCCYRCCSHWRKTTSRTPQATAATSKKSTSSKNGQFVQRLTYDLIRAGLCTAPCRFSVRLSRAEFRCLQCPSSISGCPFRYRTAPAPPQAGKSCSEAQRWRVGSSRA